MIQYIFDPVHGTIRLSSLEQRLTRSEYLFRLRFVKQSSFLNLVYPGASHSRFEHSLGVMHLADKLLHNLAKKDVYDDRVKILRVAGLLHDIGHGPFSHTSEKILRRNQYKSPTTSTASTKIHEARTVSKITENPELQAIFEDAKINSKEVSTMIVGPSEDWTSQIIHGDLDVDRMDYLVRDAFFTGVAYGTVDISRLLNKSFDLRISDGRERMFINRKFGLIAARTLLSARSVMYPVVYLHSTVRAAEAMLVRAFESVVASKGKPDLDRFIDMTDYEFLAYLRFKGDERSKQYVERLLFRRIFKKTPKIRFIPWYQLHPVVKTAIEKNNDLHKLKQWEDQLEKDLLKAIIPGYTDVENEIRPLLIDIPPIASMDECNALVYDTTSKGEAVVDRLGDISAFGQIANETLKEGWSLGIYFDSFSERGKYLTSPDALNKFSNYFIEQSYAVDKSLPKELEKP